MISSGLVRLVLAAALLVAAGCKGKKDDSGSAAGRPAMEVEDPDGLVELVNWRWTKEVPPLEVQMKRTGERVHAIEFTFFAGDEVVERSSVSGEAFERVAGPVKMKLPFPRKYRLAGPQAGTKYAAGLERVTRIAMKVVPVRTSALASALPEALRRQAERCDAGELVACFELISELQLEERVGSGSYPDAVAHYRKVLADKLEAGCERGEADLCFMLGIGLTNGTFEQDEARGRRLFEEACRRDPRHPMACDWLKQQEGSR